MDDQCFKWAVTRALNPVKREENKNPDRITKILKSQAEKLDWSGLNFTVKPCGRDIAIFQMSCGININILSYDDDENKVYTLRLSRQ